MDIINYPALIPNLKPSLTLNIKPRFNPQTGISICEDQLFTSQKVLNLWVKWVLRCSGCIKNKNTNTQKAQTEIDGTFGINHPQDWLSLPHIWLGYAKHWAARRQKSVFTDTAHHFTPPFSFRIHTWYFLVPAFKRLPEVHEVTFVFSLQ